MDRITRKELKTDRFAEEVGHTVEYVGSHRRQVLLYAGIALAVLVVAAGVYFWMKYQASQRQNALREAVLTQQATIGQAPSPLVRTFPTKAEKDAAATKAFADLAARYGGSDEADYATYMLGNIAMDQGKTDVAERHYKQVAEDGAADYASLAKLSLAEIYDAQGKDAEAERLLKGVVDKPTMLVSKEQATIALARVMADKKPQEARKLLEPLRTSERSAVSRLAIQALSAMPMK